jgi:hypothetical protein
MARKKGGTQKQVGYRNDPIDQVYAGHYRKAVKTSIAKASVKSYPDLGTVLASLPKDEDMRTKQGLEKPRSIAQKQKPQKGAVGPQTRFPEELRNVSVTAWICAAKYESSKEGDFDFHVILADSRTIGRSTKFMTAEVSGLPDKSGPDRDMLRKVRQSLLKIFAETKLDGAFHKPNPPIKVSVAGSLFFDGDHYAGAVGPQGMRPQTSWEIHPVSSLR